MFKENANRKEVTINKVLIIIAVICSVFAVGMILLAFINKPSLKTKVKGSNDMQVNYTTTESNTWDVSKNGDESVTATLDEDGLLTISGTGYMKNWSSNSDVSWYSKIEQIKQVKIEEGVMNIASNAFSGCISLTEIINLSSVTSIGNYAFEGCSNLTEIAIPERITSIGSYTFSGCSSLTEIAIPEGVISIGEGAFKGCSSLTSINLPEGVTSIGDSAFRECSSLTEIAIPEGVISIGEGAFRECSSLTEITIPEGVTSIRNSTFSECSSLTEIEIPEGVTSIGHYAFSRCSSLTEIIIPEGVTSIGNNAFYVCRSLKNITIPEGVRYILYQTFAWCSSLTEITIPSSVESIAQDAFGECSSLTEITILEGVTRIGELAFSRCINLTKITIPSSVTSIGRASFHKCSKLTEIIIPEGVTSIGSSAFTGCSSLTYITIPSSVTSIGDDAFYGCSSLTIICKSNTTAEAYAQENNVNYYVDDDGPTIEFSTNGTSTKVISTSTKVTVKDIVAGVLYSSLKYYWGTESEGVTEEQITTSFSIDETITTPKQQGDYYLWILAKDLVGNTTIERSNVFKIDAIAPTVNVSYSVTALTNQDVIVTITANEEIQEVEGWTMSGDKLKLSKVYSSNTKASGENITIKDIAGNETTVNVKITNIDKTEPTANVTYKLSSKKDNCTVEISVNEEIQEIEGWTISTDKKTIAKTYKRNTIEDVTIKDLVGNETTVKIEITSIEDVLEMNSYEIKGKYIGKINPKTLFKDFIKSIYTNMEYKLKEGDKTVADTSIMKTGQTLTIGNKSYTIVVRGDINGDGKVGIAELARTSRLGISQEDATELEMMALDVNMDGSIKVNDLAAISRMARE